MTPVVRHPDRERGGGQGLSEDELFTLLALRRRRELLRELHRAGGELTMGQLTEAIAAGEGDAPPTRKGRKAVYVSLYQTHVPKLVEAGVLESDPTRKTLRLTPRSRQLLAYLDFEPTRSKGWLSRVLGSSSG